MRREGGRGMTYAIRGVWWGDANSYVENGMKLVSVVCIQTHV